MLRRLDAAAAPSPAHVQLRQATAVAHAQVDGCFPDGLADADTYRRYLQGMQRLLQSVADADPTLAATYAEHRRRLQADCTALACAAPRAPSTVAWELDTDEARLGARYVLDGSALGARVLLRQADALGQVPEHGAAFLAYHVQQGRTQWPSLLRALSACDPASPAFARVTRAALDIFVLAADSFQCTADTRQDAP